MDVTGQGNRHINLETFDFELFKILIRPIALFIFTVSAGCCILDVLLK